MFWYRLKSNMKFLIIGIVCIIMLTGGIVFLAFSCSSQSDSETIKIDGYEELGNINLCVVFSNRENSSAVPNGEVLGKYVMAAICNGDKSGNLLYVRADGSPKLINSDQTFEKSKDPNSHNREMQNKSTVSKFFEFITNDNISNASTSEVDIFRSITEAASYMPTGQNKDRDNVILVVDSGISTKGRIDLTNPSIINANPDDIKNIKNLPSLNNIDKIEWFGFNQVCGLQEGIPTDYPINTRIQDIYINFLKASGAKEIRFDTATNGHKVLKKDNLPSISLVDFSDPVSMFEGQWDNIKLGESILGFKGDSDEFIDLDTASIVLTELANKLINDKTIHITINGFIASQSGDTTNLSQLRADKVKKELISRHVDESQITAVGKGPGPYPYLDSNGLVNAANRFIEIVKDN